jgi:hypothetical protein
MAWIKRNLFFVISIVAGLGVAGYCGYLLFAAVSANVAAKAAFLEATNTLYGLQNAKPFPSPANIQAAREDAARALVLKEEFRKAFAGFPTPPKVDNRQFNECLKSNIFRFGADATNAGVSLNPNYTFGFSQQMDNLEYPSECIAPWMQELEEMKAVLDILYKAKINFLEHIKRPLVSPNDASDDYIQLITKTNANGVTTPYRVEFRAFSTEIANVLSAIASSSNCFIVEAPFVVKSTVPLPELPQAQPPPQSAPQFYRPPPPREFQNPLEPFGGENRGRDRRDYYRPRPYPPPQNPALTAPAAPAAPETILTEKPLFVTLYIDVVKLKALETNATPTPKLRTAAR